MVSLSRGPGGPEIPQLLILAAGSTGQETIVTSPHVDAAACCCWTSCPPDSVRPGGRTSSLWCFFFFPFSLFKGKPGIITWFGLSGFCAEINLKVKNLTDLFLTADLLRSSGGGGGSGSQPSPGGGWRL